MFQLIKHSLEMRRTQSVATLVTVAVAVAVLLALVLTYVGVQDGLEKSEQRYGADLMVIPADAAGSLDETAFLFTGSPVAMYMPSDVQDQVAQTEGVGATNAQFFGQTLDASCCSASQPARLIGYDASTDWVLSPWFGDGQGQELGEDDVVVGCQLEGDFADGSGSVLGHAVDVVGVMDQTGTDLDGSILMDIDTVRHLSAENEAFADTWATYGDPSGLISAVMVKLDDSYVESEFGGSREEALDAVAAELENIDGVAVVRSSKVIGQVQGNLSSMFSIMLGAALLLALACVLSLFTRFFTVAWDRRSEIALYRALGASKHDVRVLIGGEAAVLIGGGLVVGVGLGALLYVLVPRLLAGGGSFPFVAPGPATWFLSIAALVAVFALIGLLSVAVPLRRAAAIDPSMAMQMGDID